MISKKRAGRLLDGREWNEMPANKPAQTNTDYAQLQKWGEG